MGDQLPALEFDVSLTSLVMYAGATWDFHRYHYDATYAAKQGFPLPFMDGQMAGALLARQLMQWGGPNAFVQRLSYRLRTMVFAGERLSVSGVVAGITNESDRSLALCKLDIVKTDGAYVVREAVAAVAFLPS